MDEFVSRGMAEDVVLSMNSGSSSLKFALFVVREAGPLLLAVGAVERIGIANGGAWLQVGKDRREENRPHVDHAAALETAFALLEKAETRAATIVGHRVVHGGALHVEPVRVNDDLVAKLKALIPLAPLHLPGAIEGILAVSARHPELPQVACFDTAFHASMPERARRLPLPDCFYQEGVRRYGFHGLSYEYVMSTLGPEVPSRIVIAHLGNGSSLVAVRDGRAIDTTMGCTPAGGILMGTRSGDLDPGVLVYLMREKKFSVDMLEQLVDRQSGLLAIGGTSDMKTLLERAPEDAQARLAVAMFGYGVRKAIGGLVAALGGIDLLVFTGGIGEHAAEVRAHACEGLDSFGIRLDSERNDRSDEVISANLSACSVRVVKTNEDLIVARHAFRIVRGSFQGARREVDK